jgi:hypothetical protein
MTTKSILVTTLEANEACLIVLSAINGVNHSDVQSMYGVEDNDAIGAYEAVTSQFPGKSANDIFSVTTGTDTTLFDTLGNIFYTVYNTFYTNNYIKKTYSTDVITGCGHINKKPDGVDYMIGWVLPIDDSNNFCVDHLQCHEGLTLDVAKASVSKHNEWLIANQHLFDLFLNNVSTTDAISQISTFLSSKKI